MPRPLDERGQAVKPGEVYRLRGRDEEVIARFVQSAWGDYFWPVRWLRKLAHTDPGRGIVPGQGVRISRQAPDDKETK